MKKITDALTPCRSLKLTGIADEMIKYAERVQLKDRELWKLATEQFKSFPDDADNGWRGEYWGKLMRGACIVYEYTKDEELYNILSESVRELISCADGYGRIATYSAEKEFHGWDMWSRKYVLLGLIHFIGICAGEELKSRAVSAAKAHLDYIISRMGRDKINITDTSEIWGGINSSSILEPAVLMYNLTGEKRYIDFADYIIENGGAKGFDIFKAAYENELAPFEYPVTKAYELMSCFEGVIEYYKATGDEKKRDTAIRFADKLIETEITIIGSAGCSHELFDNARVMQTSDDRNGLMQETCVTVTWMKLCFKLLKLTGGTKYADEIERSAFNALYGAVNTEESLCGCEATFDEPYYRDVYDTYHKTHRPQLFDSYSPIRAGIRGRAVGGFKAMQNNTSYCGCCIAIGAAGIGLVPQSGVMQTDGGWAFMLYLPGEACFCKNGKDVVFKTETEYPSEGKITIKTELKESERFKVQLRIPYWAKGFSLAVNKEELYIPAENGAVTIDRIWNGGDVIELELDMSIRALRSENDNYISFMRGPLVLARDARLGKTGTAISGPKEEMIFAKTDKLFKSMVQGIIDTGEEKIKVTDYASSGKTWRRDSETEAWIKVL